MSARPSWSITQRLIHFVAFGFGAGHAPVAPGTAGTLVAIPVFLLLREGGIVFYCGSVAALFALGVWICGVAERDLGAQDAPGIVWDEIVGYLIAMTAMPAQWSWVVLGFVLFRLFDITKPFPIRWFERRVPGGFGVMLDDALAAVYVAIILHASLWASARWYG
jgi:phosphatidylglycerophosphatase A